MGDVPNDDSLTDDNDVDWVRLYVLAPNLWSDWLDDFEAEVDEGGPDPAVLARFVDRCYVAVRCLSDVHAQLPGLGLTLARFVELREAANAAEQRAVTKDSAPLAQHEREEDRRYLDRQRERRRPRTPGPLSDDLAGAIINLHLRGLDNERIACAFDIPDDWPALVIARTHLHAGAHAVVREHLAGKTVAQINKTTKVPPASVVRILGQIGDPPNGTVKRVDARARAATIVKLRENQGLTYKQIANKLGCSMDTVKNVLKRKRRPGYGSGGPRPAD